MDLPIKSIHRTDRRLGYTCLVVVDFHVAPQYRPISELTVALVARERLFTRMTTQVPLQAELCRERFALAMRAKEAWKTARFQRAAAG